MTVQQYGTEGLESSDLVSSEQQSRTQCRSNPQSSIHMETVHRTGSSSDGPEMESKAERIARYKAERRRQLAERYGISLDQEPGLDHPSRYARTRKESDSSERHIRRESVVEEVGDIPLSAYTSTAVTNLKSRGSGVSQSQPDPDYDMARTRADSLSEREWLMNLENQRRAAPPESSSASYMDVTSLSSSARKSVPPSSPKMNRHSSLSSPKLGASPGDMFIEQQSHNILSRQG